MLNDLILPSLLAEPLLLQGRSLLDAGTGVGLPGLPLALASPARPTILVEPRTRCTGLIHWLLEDVPPLSVQTMNERLEDVPFHRLPPVQLVTRAALDWSELRAALPTSAAPILRWSGPSVFPPPSRPGWIRRHVLVTWKDLHQEFYWWGPETMFHVKQNHWTTESRSDWSIDPEPIDEPNAP